MKFDNFLKLLESGIVARRYRSESASEDSMSVENEGEHRDYIKARYQHKNTVFSVRRLPLVLKLSGVG